MLGEVAHHAYAFHMRVAGGNADQRCLQKLTSNVDANQPAGLDLIQPEP